MLYTLLKRGATGVPLRSRGLRVTVTLTEETPRFRRTSSRKNKRCLSCGVRLTSRDFRRHLKDCQGRTIPERIDFMIADRKAEQKEPPYRPSEWHSFIWAVAGASEEERVGAVRRHFAEDEARAILDR